MKLTCSAEVFEPIISCDVAASQVHSARLPQTVVTDMCAEHVCSAGPLMRSGNGRTLGPRVENLDNSTVAIAISARAHSIQVGTVIHSDFHGP